MKLKQEDNDAADLEVLKVVNISVDYSIFARVQAGKRAWKWKQSRSTNIIIVDWKTEDTDWDQFKELVIKSCNTEFDKVPKILRAADSGKKIGLLWAPYIQGSKDYPKGTVKDRNPLVDSETLKAWLL